MNTWTIEYNRLLENVQIRAINMISNLGSFSNSKKLVEVGLQSLEDRRLRYDMIQTYNKPLQWPS